MTKKYQTGIQSSVEYIIQQSSDMNLPHITKQQIMQEIKKLIPNIKNIDTKIGQALYQLQQPRKHKRQEIKKIGHDKYTTISQYTRDVWSYK